MFDVAWLAGTGIGVLADTAAASFDVSSPSEALSASKSASEVGDVIAASSAVFSPVISVIADSATDVVRATSARSDSSALMIFLASKNRVTGNAPIASSDMIW